LGISIYLRWLQEEWFMRCRSLLVFIIILSLAGGVFADTAVAVWSIYEGSGSNVYDTSGHGNTGTLYNMDQNDWVSGVNNLALDFDGVNDYMRVADSSSLGFGSGSFSILMWMKTTSTNGGMLLIKGTYGGAYSGKHYSLRFHEYDARIKFSIDDGTTRSFVDTGTDIYIADGSWHRIIAIRDTSVDKLKIYVDGALIAQADDNSGNIDSPGEALFLCRAGEDSSSDYANVTLDGVTLCDYVLSQAQIELYSSQAHMDYAWNPYPTNKATVDATGGLTLTWSASNIAYSHDVYFGTSETYVGLAQRLDGDINGDGPVDVGDIMILAQQWLGAAAEPYADLNGDGNVNLADLAAVSAEWLESGNSLFAGNQTGTSYNPGVLEEGQTYYWRVDEVNGLNTYKGTVWSFTVNVNTNYEVRDLYSDSWVATDALNRELPGYSECGPPREDRYVALFYFLWLGQHGTGGPYDITKLLAANPTNPAWGPPGSFHHWGESELGYYLSSDDYVMRKHAHMLADAGVDVIVIDVTNGLTYQNNYLTLCSVFRQIRAEGGTTPQIAFMANYNGDGVVETLYENLYSKNLYPELWFYFKGKPLILAPLNGAADPAGGTITYSQDILDFFTMRYSWTWMNIEDDDKDTWKWMDDFLQQSGWHESFAIPEEISVSVGIVPHANQGRSYHNSTQPAHDAYGLSGTENQGLCFAEQWSRLNQIDPELLFITGWNEWVAQRQVFVGTGDPVTDFIGDPLEPGDTWFIDTYNQEYSRDIEPMKNGHTDNYYYQMIDGIRRYKGVRPPQSPSGATTITIDGSFTDWASVAPAFGDSVRDTTHRYKSGWGIAGTYVNNTGRNDFVTLKVAYDATYVYFYAETDENITSYTDLGWMMLFIDTDQDRGTGWEGYDYLVNLVATSPTTTTLKTTSSGWNWVTVNSSIPYRVSGNKMEIGIPRSDIGKSGGDVAFDFHWADNMQHVDIIEFSISGDSAPNRRANYRYSTVAPDEWTQLTYDDFEAGWGNYTDGGTDCSRYTGGTYAHQGTCAADIQDNTSTSSFYSTSGINVSSYSQIKVEFSFYANSMEPGENFFVEFWNGSTWQIIANYISDTNFRNNVFHSIRNSLIIDSGTYNFSTAAKFRFRCDASDDNDDIYIDEIRISAK
jgi:hypothetical protein